MVVMLTRGGLSSRMCGSRCPLHAVCGEMLVAVDGSGSLDEVVHVQSPYMPGKVRAPAGLGVGGSDVICRC